MKASEFTELTGQTVAGFARARGLNSNTVQGHVRAGYCKWPTPLPPGSNIKNHPLYFLYQGIYGRCYTPSNTGHKKYGAAGIKMSGRWYISFYNFLEDMGPRPSPAHSIDRIDNSKGYSKENCRWATISLQNHNQRKRSKNRFIGVTRGAGHSQRPWVARFTQQKEQYFASQYRAAIGYNRMAIKHFGKDANLNYIIKPKGDK